MLFCVSCASSGDKKASGSQTDGTKTASDAQTGDEKADKEPLTLDYVDAYGEHFTAVINPDLKMHDYNWDYLVRKGSSFISYNGDPNYEVRQGLDVSAHQGEINWKKLKKAGFKFVFIRILARAYGEKGQLLPDQRFEENYKGARKAGLDIGVYVFSQAVDKKEALEEADYVIGHLKGKELDLPVVFDPEKIRNDKARTDNVSGAQFTKNTIAFCEKIRKAGYEPMIYSNMVWEDQVFEMEKLQDYPVWYGDYEKQPQTPYAFTFWQYTEKGEAPGVSGRTDLDIQFIRK